MDNHNIISTWVRKVNRVIDREIGGYFLQNVDQVLTKSFVFLISRGTIYESKSSGSLGRLPWGVTMHGKLPNKHQCLYYAMSQNCRLTCSRYQDSLLGKSPIVSFISSNPQVNSLLAIFGLVRRAELIVSCQPKVYFLPDNTTTQL